MVFSKGTGYGIRALAYLARQSEGRTYGIGEIAANEKIPSEYLRKLLSELRRHRLVSSAKGIHGGYMLARPAHLITLWDVFSLLDQDPYLDECIICGSRDKDRSCPICREWKQISDSLVHLLKCQTIADFANYPSGGHKKVQRTKSNKQ
ncbi:MAG: Rrf2 family transcriptional regulator [Pyrinomonadaceae bacterium]|nr:Rrf2 family transcriptional regulator [Pyrinomonadaceae bacterium]